MRSIDGGRPQVGYLFEEDGTSLRAVAIDDVGINLPDSDKGWRFVRPLQLTIQHLRPLGVDIDDAIRGIVTKGYYIWDEVRDQSGLTG